MRGPRGERACSDCGAELAGVHCSKCGAWNWSNPPAELAARAPAKVIRFEDIETEVLPRISLGIVDRCLDVQGWEKSGKSGVVVSDVVLLGGGPGAGKSTLCLGIAECICAVGTCLYVAAEEDLMAIKVRGRRLKIKTRNRLQFLPAMGGGVDLLATIYELRPAGVIIDSIDGLTGRDPEAEMALLDILKKACVLLQMPAIVISQVTKELDFSGFQAKKHHVDVLLTLTADPELKTGNNEAVRILETTDKNRNGRAYVETFLSMTETGLSYWNSEEEGIENGVRLPEES
jgi:predicted ATP-dependent serine protease